jgi:hypothetical protein
LLSLQKEGLLMGQFDLETAAASTQLEFEELSSTPGGEFAEIIGDLLKLIGAGGPFGLAGGVLNLVLKVRKLAGASYASNLIYAITAVRNDLKTLYDRNENLRGRIESLGSDPKFAEAIAALALRAMQTSVKDRLKRLARIVVNGVKDDDLEPESIDDMMRAAVELRGIDIQLLKKLYDAQSGLLSSHKSLSSEWSQQVAYGWSNSFSFLDSPDAQGARGSLVRLQASGLIQEVRTMMTPTGRMGTQPFGLLPEGKKFYERLQEIAAV